MTKKNIRSKMFWMQDSIKGGAITRHLDEINKILENPQSKASKNIREKNLNNLLHHAAQTTAYYSKYDKATSILDFPVIKKTVIQDNFEAFRSQPFLNKNNFKVSTSGSTGVPFFHFQDAGKKLRNKADVIYFLKCCDFEMGDRLFNLAVWKEHNKKGKLGAWLQNVLQFDISKLTDIRVKELLNHIINDKHSKKTILGYVSALETIMRYLEKNNIPSIDAKINTIIANSEYLSLQTKKKLKDYFNTPVLSRYSSEEVGIVAHQTIASQDKFIVNNASYYIELLEFNSDFPAKPNEFGRIVVTDLFNYAMPLIRYDTGDIAKSSNSSILIKEFDQIEGRKLDLIYDTSGNVISSHLVYTKFYKYYKLMQQYQFIQQDEKTYEVKLNIYDSTFKYEKELIADIKKDFGEDANVYISYVNEIPSLDSGKRRKVINNYK